MNEPTRVIAIKDSALKPIRCKGARKPYLDLTGNGFEKRCKRSMIAVVAGDFLIPDPYVISGFDVPSSPYIHGLGTFPSQLCEIQIQGKTYRARVYEINGRSLDVYCDDCGTARKIVGIKNIGLVENLSLDSLHFK